MKKSASIIFIIFVVAILLALFCGCSSSNFKQEDFAISLKSVEIDGNKVVVKVEFENKSWHNGLVVSSGTPFRPSSMIWICCEKKIEDDDVGYGYASPAVYQWIICKQKISKTQEFQLQSGTYEIYAVVDISFAGNKDSLHYVTEVYTVEIA